MENANSNPISTYWIPIAAIIATLLSPVLQILLQELISWIKAKFKTKQLSPTTAGKVKGSRAPSWILPRLPIIFIQFISNYFLVEQFQSAEPLNRSSVVLIAICASVSVACVIGFFIVSIYQYMDAFLDSRGG
jgi:hypothetical protein